MNLVLRDPNPIGIVDSDPVDRKTAKMFCTYDNTLCVRKLLTYCNSNENFTYPDKIKKIKYKT